MKILILVLALSAAFIVFDYVYRVQSNNDDSGTVDIKGTEEINGKVIKAGLFKVIRSGGLVKSANTSTGKAISKPVIQLVSATDRIPLVKNAHMSLQYRIWGLPDQPAYIKLRRVLKHPAMTVPDGSVSTGSDYMINGHVSVGQVIAYTGYGLNEDYEMLEGEWTFQIWLENKKLVEQTFVTYWPDTNEIQHLGYFTPPKINTSVISVNSPHIKPINPGSQTQVNQTAARRDWMN